MIRGKGVWGRDAKGVRGRGCARRHNVAMVTSTLTLLPSHHLLLPHPPKTLPTLPLSKTFAPPLLMFLPSLYPLSSSSTLFSSISTHIQFPRFFFPSPPLCQSFSLHLCSSYIPYSIRMPLPLRFFSSFGLALPTLFSSPSSSFIFTPPRFWALSLTHSSSSVCYLSSLL